MAERLLCGDEVERSMWTSVLEETIAVRTGRPSPSDAEDPAPVARGVTDIDPHVEQEMRDALLRAARG